MADRTFSSYENGPHPSRDGRASPVKIIVGVDNDVASEVDARNGWVEPGELSTEQSDAMIAIATRGLTELFMFCFHGQTLDRKGMRTAIRRFISVAWMLKSEELVGANGKPLSLDKLSKLPQIRCTRCTLSLLAQEFGKRWGFRVRVQKRVSSKPNYAHAAIGGWAKRRARAKALPPGKETPRIMPLISG